MHRSPPDVVSLIAALTDNRDVDVLESSLLKTIQELFSPDWTAIYHITRKGEPEFALGMRDGELQREAGEEPITTLLALPGVTSFPITSRSDNLLGHFLVRREKPLSSDEQKLMASFFRIYDNYLSVLKDAQTDRLTGLLNRHTFDDQLIRALKLIRQASADETNNSTSKRKQVAHNGSFFLAEIDIDHFKSINDRYGHLYGDEVLLIIAQLLRATFRKSDLIYRFGGEEFIVIVYVKEKADAAMTFERLRRAVEKHKFPQVGKVTISIGVTEINVISTPVELLGRADQALYYAKGHGRNQVAFYETLLAENKVDAPPHSDDVTFY